MVIWKL